MWLGLRLETLLQKMFLVTAGNMFLVPATRSDTI
jgi:hypothetical protein